MPVSELIQFYKLELFQLNIVIQAGFLKQNMTNFFGKSGKKSCEMTILEEGKKNSDFSAR